MIDRSTPPSIHQVPILPIPETETIYLSNGIKLITLPRESAEDITRITFSWNGGSFDMKNHVTAEIATYLRRTGGANINPEKMSDLLDYNGAHLSSELSSHNNTLTLLTLNSSIDNLLAIVVDTLNEPLFYKEQFETIKSRLAASRATALEHVTTHAEELNNRLCFGAEHRASQTYLPEEIERISFEDVTVTGNILIGSQPPVVFAVGNLTNNVLSTIKKRLCNINCNNTNHGTITIVPPAKSSSSRLVSRIPHSLQAAIKISTPTINRSHPDYEAVRVMTTALGGYFGSRLMSNIREEKGLTYGINAGTYGYREGAFITISCQCDNRYVDQVIHEVENEIKKLATQPMEQHEIEAVKQTMNSTLLAMLNTPFNIMDYYIVQRHVMTPPDYFQRQQEALASSTPESIRDTAARYLLDTPRLISIAGDIAP